MAQPRINLRDGSSTTTQLVFTTNADSFVLTGTIDTATTVIQVSIDGGAYNADPTLVEISGTMWAFPSPTSYPDGYPLAIGTTVIALRAVDIMGVASASSTATITRLLQSSTGEEFIPTGIQVRRHFDYVTLLAAVPVIETGSALEFKGFNFYASSTAAGATGYFKINRALATTVSSSVTEEELADFDTAETVFEVESKVVRVRVTQEDEFGNEEATVVNRAVDSSAIAAPIRLKLSHSLQTRQVTSFIGFDHDRRGGAAIINTDQFVDVDDAEPLYYVVTSVLINTSTNEEIESPYSQEILGSPLSIDTTLRNLPVRKEMAIVQSFISQILRVNKEISLIPGNTTRDVSIDPFSSEAERIWFMVDFSHRCQSLATLLQIDDANGDGISDAVATSAYKLALKAALGLQSDQSVQQLIDSQFDKLCSNWVTPRLPGTAASVDLTLWRIARPTQDIPIASGTTATSKAEPENGISAQRYIIGGSYLLPAADADAYYNFERQRYEITVFATCEQIGEAGNRPAGTIESLTTGVSGLSVTNLEGASNGKSRETNAQLAERGQLAFVGVDTGTEGGTKAKVIGRPGIIKTRIVKSGDAHMMRDYDPVRRKHIGGKVDVWIQGKRERTVTETFAFAFAIIRDVRCQIIDPTDLIFRVLDTRLTASTPLIEILDVPARGLGVRNVTQGQDYDLTGVTILDYQTFQLDNSLTQPTTAIDDVITVDARFRSVNRFVPTHQPVRRVTAVSGELSGALTTAGYTLYKTEDPLEQGESTLAQDYILVNQIGGVPSGDTVPINDEEHVMIGQEPEKLKSIGVNTATLRVFDEARAVEYEGPESPTPDFTIVEGTATTPASIIRTANSTIVSGQTVSVDYEHDENFVVNYVVNDLLAETQRLLDRFRHITADVLVKQCIENSVDYETTIQLKAKARKEIVDPAIRTNCSIELNSKIIGQGSAQSDMINAIDSTAGVDFQVIPIARMGYGDGSRKLREAVASFSQRLSGLDIGGNQAFILTEPLEYATTDGGGRATEHRGVFQNDEAMVLADSVAEVCESANGAFIIGADGASIAGYSDDATLIALGFTDPEDLEAERLTRTANHVVLSLSGAGIPSDAPENHVYAVSYVVRGDVGPHDLTSSQVEFLTLGNLVLTYRTA